MGVNTYTNQKDLLTRIEQLKAEGTRTWYDEGTDRMKSHTPSISVNLAATASDWTGPTINMEINKKQLTELLRQLRLHEESFVTDTRWCTEAHHEFRLYESTNAANGMTFSIGFEKTDTRFQDNGKGNYVGYINSDGDKVRWD